ncbi:hypothetical protein JHC27_01690, partial [archaeon]|nr:hypothetical protein [archaeon]
YKTYGRLPDKVMNAYLLGPYKLFNSEALRTVKLDDFLNASYNTKAFMERNDRIPDFVEVGNTKVSPVDFLSSGARLYTKLYNHESPKYVELVEGIFEPYCYVSSEGAKNSWRWVIFPENFEAWNLVELAKLQTWTIKPAKPSF